MRFMGAMLAYEVEICKSYRDDNNLKIIIEAGKHGWTVIYADYSTEFQECEDIPENNFNKAYKRAEMNLGRLTAI